MENWIISKPLVAALQGQIRDNVAVLNHNFGIVPCLHVIQVGDDPASTVYVNHKKAKAEACDIACTVHRLDDDVCQNDACALIDTINADTACHGCILQLPAPIHLDADALLGCIAMDKDVDGLGPKQNELLNIQNPKALYPATPLGILRLLEALRFKITDINAVVVGRSNLVGAPIAKILQQRGALVTTFSKENPIETDVLKRADLVVCAAGVPGLITADMLNPNAIVIDVGITRTAENKLMGDVDPAAVQYVKGLTKVPGGVGPMTVLSLLTNTVDAAFMQCGLERPVWNIPYF